MSFARKVVVIIVLSVKFKSVSSRSSLIFKFSSANGSLIQSVILFSHKKFCKFYCGTQCRKSTGQRQQGKSQRLHPLYKSGDRAARRGNGLHFAVTVFLIQVYRFGSVRFRKICGITVSPLNWRTERFRFWSDAENLWPLGIRYQPKTNRTLVKVCDVGFCRCAAS